MAIDVEEILNQLDPQDRAQLDADYVKFLTREMKELAVNKQEQFYDLFRQLAAILKPEQVNELMKRLEAQAENKPEPNGNN